jgi:hypothetical protein
MMHGKEMRARRRGKEGVQDDKQTGISEVAPAIPGPAGSTGPTLTGCPRAVWGANEGQYGRRPPSQKRYSWRCKG